MKSLFIATLIALPLSLMGQKALALQVGDHAPCLVLNHISPVGVEKEFCISTPKVPGTFVIIEFFQTTCGDCHENFPNILEVARRAGNHATVRMVGLDRDEKEIRNFVIQNQRDLTFDVAIDSERDAKRAFDVSVTPTVFVLSPEKKVLFRYEGVLAPQQKAEILHMVGAQ